MSYENFFTPDMQNLSDAELAVKLQEIEWRRQQAVLEQIVDLTEPSPHPSPSPSSSAPFSSLQIPRSPSPPPPDYSSLGFSPMVDDAPAKEEEERGEIVDVSFGLPEGSAAFAISEDDPDLFSQTELQKVKEEEAYDMLRLFLASEDGPDFETLLLAQQIFDQENSIRSSSGEGQTLGSSSSGSSIDRLYSYSSSSVGRGSSGRVEAGRPEIKTKEKEKPKSISTKKKAKTAEEMQREMEAIRQQQLEKWKKEKNIRSDPVDQSSSLVPKPTSNSSHLASQLHDIRQQQLKDYKKDKKKSSPSSSSSSSSSGKTLSGSKKTTSSREFGARTMTLADLQKELLETDDSLASKKKAAGDSNSTKKTGGLRKVMMTISDLVRQESSPETLEAIGRKCLDLTNTFRAENGLSPLIWSGSMHSIAIVHSKNMGDKKVPFGHDGFHDRVRQFPFRSRSAGENVAMSQGHSSVAQVAVDGWIKSPGHRKNLLGNFNYCTIGVYRTSSGAYYLTQLFALVL